MAIYSMTKETISITISNGGKEKYPAGVSILDVLKDRESAEEVVAARVNGNLTDLNTTLDTSATLEFVTADSKEGMDICRHSASHVMAQAVKELYEDARLGIGPTIEDGFYYDFERSAPFGPDDLEMIEERMRDIIKRDIPFTREEMEKSEALRIFEERDEPYKQELIAGIEDETVSVYRQRDFVDLCRGPHLQSTGRIRAFKLLSTAGAYWKGDEKRKMLQRIYGTAFPTEKALKEYLNRIDEAKKRDHRKLGKELDLFSVEEGVGAGLILWHPRGSMVRGIIEDYWKNEHYKMGYDVIYSPHIAKIDLWNTSGHLDFYKDNMYSPMDVEGQGYVVKPMNCPFHVQVYKGHVRSYRDLPIRYAELGTVYRYERSGVLHGLLRVRGFTQDDAHIFCTPDQLGVEIKGVLNFTLYILRSFGFNEYAVYLSTRPDKHVGTEENWDRAEAALKSALEDSAIEYAVDPGEGVFYGPKIDIKIKDVLGRAWQCSTIQVDFNLPERFDVEYRGADGGFHRPIMVHRALMGSLERFFGCLIEHYGGAFPVWLAPVQVSLLTVTGRCDNYAEEICAGLRESGIRAETDTRNEKLGFKIREAQMSKVPYMAVIGDKEVANKTLSIRSRDGRSVPEMPIDGLIDLVQKENRPIGGGPR